MSNIRLDFYQAVNKANLYQPKPKKKKKVVKETVSVEDQIKALLNESESAIINDEVEVDNSQIVSYVNNVYKKDEKTLLREKEEERLWKRIEEERQKARKEYRNLCRTLEKLATSRGGATTVTAAAAASAAAGAGAGAGGGSGNKVQGYYVPGYVELGYIQ